MYKLLTTDDYIKRSSKFLKKHPDLEDRYKKILDILIINPHHPSLRLHKLKGKLAGFYSVSINLSYRITLDFIIQEKTIIPIDIGDHDDIY